MPAVTNPQFPPPWELGPGPADPALSASFSTYTGSGYAPVGQGTINTGNPAAITPGPEAAQVRFFVGSDGNLYGLDNVTGTTFKVAPGGAAQPPNYSPTR